MSYEFADIPVEPIEAGSTVLVAGPALSRAEELTRAMVLDGNRRGEGTLFVSTGMTCERLLEECRGAWGELDEERTGIIDCTGQNINQYQPDAAVRYVSTQSDLTGIGMKFSALYESLYGDATEGRVRTSLISLSSLSMYVDMRTLFQFTQTLSGRIDSAGGFGAFAIDPTTHDTKTVNTLSQAVDGRIEVREPENVDADGELRVRGLRNQPEEWQPFTVPDRR